MADTQHLLFFRVNLVTQSVKGFGVRPFGSKRCPDSKLWTCATCAFLLPRLYIHQSQYVHIFQNAHIINQPISRHQSINYFWPRDEDTLRHLRQVFFLSNTFHRQSRQRPPDPSRHPFDECIGAIHGCSAKANPTAIPPTGKGNTCSTHRNPAQRFDKKTNWRSGIWHQFHHRGEELNIEQQVVSVMLCFLALQFLLLESPASVSEFPSSEARVWKWR